MYKITTNKIWSALKLLSSKLSLETVGADPVIHEPASQLSFADDQQGMSKYRLRKSKETNIKNVIFDLGNVIVDLDVPKSDQQLYEITGRKYSDASKEDLKTFHDFETGRIAEDIFLNYFIGKSKKSVQALDVINAWNAMLVNIPWARLEMMRKLKDHYQVFILSNTNETHIRWTNHYIQTRYQEAGFKSFVHHALYSHQLQARKPDADIFEKVLATYQLVPQETIFFDDHPENVAGAKQLGIQAILVQPEDEIIHIVDRLLPAYVSKEAN